MDYSKPIKSLAQANDVTEELWKEIDNYCKSKHPFDDPEAFECWAKIVRLSAKLRAYDLRKLRRF